MRSGSQRGFTYLSALFLIAILAAGLAATGEVWSRARQRQREAELTWIGSEFTEAIGLYYQRSPGTVKRYPEKLEDLLEDRRHLSMQRYLRRIYRDPMTGTTEWGLVRAPEGGIKGVYSLSTKPMIKQDARSQPRAYSHWQFTYEPPAPASGT